MIFFPASTAREARMGSKNLWMQGVRDGPMPKGGLAVDLECGSTTNNAERQKQVSYTNSHFLSESRYITKKANNIKSIADLKGKTVVSTAASTNIKQANARNIADNLGMTILTAKDHAEATSAVLTLGRKRPYVARNL